MNSEHHLSIVIPVLNEASTLAATLEALVPLRHSGVEVIVVDGGSQDATLTLARPLADQVLEGPVGRARQMNLGAYAASGEWLLFLHADTHLPEDALPAISRALGGNRVWGRFDIHLSGASSMLPMISAMMNRRSRLTGIATGDQAMFMTLNAFERVGGFPDQPLMEDIEISRKLKRLSRPACLGQKVTSAGRRWDNHGAWKTILLMWGLRYRYWRGETAERLAEEYRHVR
ncbi:TIGR04283 family arsenosugar biosynthesis glycosyltransferase [Vreelandella rituensis]|uniref:TIGR04283 family arsenosugar biosynthesis glycosyltransferase n=1 Tax=Vreelandella rituensis TaxID=2282306 RepID=UPI001F02C8AC|nr:TIGR04283 family arsenosugar biosynthesis glycosyltransferase [Halomonas rituensis]